MKVYEIYVNGSFKAVSTTESGKTRAIDKIKRDLGFRNAIVLMNQTVIKDGNETEYTQFQDGNKFLNIETKSKHVKES